MKKVVLVVLVLVLVAVIFLFFSDSRVVGLKTLGLGLRITQDYQVERDISFGDEQWQTLDVYRPSEQIEDAPVIIFIYGGGWSWGDKSMYDFAADAFVRKGYVVVVPDYIKYPEGRFPQFIEDGASALAWTKNNIANYSGDPNLLFLSGHSAGAHTAALLVSDEKYLAKHSMSPNDIVAMAGIAGPYTFTPKDPQYVTTFGEENFKTMKASNHIQGDEPPMLLLHATGDTAVGLFNFEELHQAIVQQSGQVETILYGDDINHISILLNLHPWFAETVNVGEDVDQFFKKHLPNTTVSR